MIDMFDQYMLAHYLGETLSFTDIQQLALVSKQISRVAVFAAQYKVRLWSGSYNQSEQSCIQSILQGHAPTSYSPALHSLQMRYLRRDVFFKAVRRDPRLTRAQKAELFNEDFENPSPLYYWFIFECLPYPPVRVNFSTRNCQKNLRLPQSTVSLCDGILSMYLNIRSHVQFDRINLENSNTYTLCGVLTNRNELWVTSQWPIKAASAFRKYCLLEPDEMVCSGRTKCPFCCLPIDQPNSHTMQCMLQYTNWIFAENDINTFDTRITRRRQVNGKYNPTTKITSTSHGLSSRAGKRRRHCAGRQQCGP